MSYWSPFLKFLSWGLEIHTKLEHNPQYQTVCYLILVFTCLQGLLSYFLTPPCSFYMSNRVRLNEGEQSMMDTQNEVWKFGGRENKKSLAGAWKKVQLVEDWTHPSFCMFFSPPHLLSPSCSQFSPIPFIRLPLCVQQLFMFACVAIRSLGGQAHWRWMTIDVYIWWIYIYITQFPKLRSIKYLYLIL